MHASWQLIIIICALEVKTQLYLFRNEVESYFIQPGQDLNSHLDLLQRAIERWLNIELMESKLLEIGSATKMSASKFVLDHPEVAYNNSYDMTDAEILAQGFPSYQKPRDS